MEYLSILGREPTISLAELDSLFSGVHQIAPSLATFSSPTTPDIGRLGGSLKLAVKLSSSPLDYLRSAPAGKLTIGISDYSHGAPTKSALLTAMKLKKILTRHDHSVRIIEGKSPVLSTATSLHNGLSGKNPKKHEFIKVDNAWYRVIGVQDIDAYSRRDQARPARDARVGMLPPKLAQILINLCGPLPSGSRILDPFCGTGVVLQEALLMGYRAYGTDLNPHMIEYTKRNLEWLVANNLNNCRRVTGVEGDPHGACDMGEENTRQDPPSNNFEVSNGDATSHTWTPPIDAVACECFLGQPMSQPPSSIKLKSEMQECSRIILGFLRNLAPQIPSGTPVTLAIPAWLRIDGTYSRLQILDEITPMRYNVSNKTVSGLLYFREGQIVARDIIILRKN